MDTLLSDPNQDWTTVLMLSEQLGEVEGTLHKVKLNNGLALLTFKVPDTVRVDNVVKGKFSLVSSLENVSFSNEFKLTVIAPIEVTVGSNKGGTNQKRKHRLVVINFSCLLLLK